MGLLKQQQQQHTAGYCMAFCYISCACSCLQHQHPQLVSNPEAVSHNERACLLVVDSCSSAELSSCVSQNCSAVRAADFTERAFGRELLAALEVAPPAALPVVGAKGRIRRSRAYPVFANSRGEVTAYDAHGKLQWQVRRRCCP
jgi:hypothetical protein